MTSGLPECVRWAATVRMILMSRLHDGQFIARLRETVGYFFNLAKIAAPSVQKSRLWAGTVIAQLHYC